MRGRRCNSPLCRRRGRCGLCFSVISHLVMKPGLSCQQRGEESRKRDVRSPPAANGYASPIRPSDSERVVGHLSTPGDTSPSHSLGSHNLNQNVEGSRGGRIRDGNTEGDVVGCREIRVADGCGGVAVLGWGGRSGECRAYGKEKGGKSGQTHLAWMTRKLHSQVDY